MQSSSESFDICQVALKCMYVYAFVVLNFVVCNLHHVFLAVDVKTDDRAKMSVAAKMSLFKVGETGACRIYLGTASA